MYNASFQALHLQRQVAPARPLVQQWVSHARPDLSFTDMAALRSHELPTLMKSTPNVVLGRGAWAPFNTRGTLFLPEAYWALFLPPAQPSYVADVVRSYWATRLLWRCLASRRCQGCCPAQQTVRQATMPLLRCEGRRQRRGGQLALQWLARRPRERGAEPPVPRTRCCRSLCGTRARATPSQSRTE